MCVHFLFWRRFLLRFVTSEVSAFNVLRFSFLFQKMLGQKRWVLPLLRPKTACWKTILTRQYTNGPRKPANWYSGFTWPATEISRGTWRCCIQMHVTGQCSVNDCMSKQWCLFKVLNVDVSFENRFFFLFAFLCEIDVNSQFLYVVQLVKC